MIVNVFCDGACSGNPGPGGWAALIKFGTQSVELTGAKTQSTSNRMELSAVYAGIRAALKIQGAKVIVHSDSQYAVTAMVSASEWKAKGWRNTSGPCANVDALEALLALVQGHRAQLEYRHLSRCSTPEMQRVDTLAKAAVKR